MGRGRFLCDAGRGLRLDLPARTFAVQMGKERLGVTSPRGCASRQRASQAGALGRAESDVQRSQRFLQLLSGACADEGDDVLSLGDYPSDGSLGH